MIVTTDPTTELRAVVPGYYQILQGWTGLIAKYPGTGCIIPTICKGESTQYG